MQATPTQGAGLTIIMHYHVKPLWQVTYGINLS